MRIGILTQAQNASERTGIGEEKEQIALAYNGAVLDKVDEGGDVTDTDLDTEFGINGTNADAEGNSPIIVTFTDTNRVYIIDENGNITGPLEAPEETEEPETGGQSFEMKYGVIEIKWLTGSTDYATETPNAPVIKSDLPTGTTMKLVHYDESGNPVDGTDYNYNENRWANAEVEIDGVKSYFVWIPRYAYKIVYFDTPEHQEAYRNGISTEGIIGYSDSRGIVDINGRKVDGVTSTTSINVGDYFRVHSAFTDEVDNGGWSEEIPGIWVGKYESSLVNKADSSNINTSSVTIGNKIVDETNNADKAIAVKANMSSWRYCTIGNFFTSAKAYSTNLNSHMLKNSEWGAVAYLTESRYGRNGIEVEINDNSSYITADEDILSNVNQSSTGNETGIYDLSGGALEYVSAYFSGGDETLLDYGNSFTEIKKSDKYSTVYGTTYKTGDATYETSGWHKDHGGFVYSLQPFFIRSAGYGNGSDAGIFYRRQLQRG